MSPRRAERRRRPRGRAGGAGWAGWEDRQHRQCGQYRHRQSGQAGWAGWRGSLGSLGRPAGRQAVWQAPPSPCPRSAAGVVHDRSSWRRVCEACGLRRVGTECYTHRERNDNRDQAFERFAKLSYVLFYDITWFLSFSEALVLVSISLANRGVRCTVTALRIRNSDT